MVREEAYVLPMQTTSGRYRNTCFRYLKESQPLAGRDDGRWRLGRRGYRGFRAARFFTNAEAGREEAASARCNCARRRGAAKSTSARNFNGSLPWPEYKKLTGMGGGSKRLSSKVSCPARNADST